jgi:PadR family transcriptional regulator, regulatory protein PadR
MANRLSFTTVAVLKALVDGSRYGFDIMEAAGLASGTVYPILGRLEEGGYVRSQWEPAAVAQKARRPARRYYVITGPGRRALAESLEHYQTLGGRIPAGARLARARG